jgi:hypothetical protein
MRRPPHERRRGPGPDPGPGWSTGALGRHRRALRPSLLAACLGVARSAVGLGCRGTPSSRGSTPGRGVAGEGDGAQSRGPAPARRRRDDSSRPTRRPKRPSPSRCVPGYGPARQERQGQRLTVRSAAIRAIAEIRLPCLEPSSFVAVSPGTPTRRTPRTRAPRASSVRGTADSDRLPHPCLACTR